jgi:hypothetical protein
LLALTFSFIEEVNLPVNVSAVFGSREKSFRDVVQLFRDVVHRSAHDEKVDTFIAE